jgi:acyl-CoA thioester hydrolase
MDLSGKTSYRVPFHDVDVMQIVWHGNYLRYFELARTALVQAMGFDWPEVRAWGYVMPVVDVKIQYKRYLVYNQDLELIARCADPLLPAFDLRYEIKDLKGELYATGSTRQVYVDAETKAISYALPAVFEQRFRELIAKREATHAP